MKRSLLIIGFVFLAFSLYAKNNDLLEKAKKNTKKILDSELTEFKELSEFGKEKDQIFLFTYGDNLNGYLVISSAIGRMEEFDFMVIYNSDKEVLAVKVLIYRSMYGGQIMNKKWLKQFEGLIPGKKLEYRKDVQAISGATFSAESITESVNRLTELLGRY